MRWVCGVTFLFYSENCSSRIIDEACKDEKINKDNHALHDLQGPLGMDGDISDHWMVALVHSCIDYEKRYLYLAN